MSQRGKKLLDVFRTSIGRKILTGITGLALVLFVILHMAGNLTYFSGDPGAYNLYADKLISLGPLLIMAEILLLAAFLLHAYLGVSIYLGKRRARRQGYRKYRTAGGNSKQTLSSRSMIFTGIVLLVFLVIHLNTFKFGPGIEDGYFADAHGVAVEELDFGPDETAVVGGEVVVRDLRRLVTEKFQHWYYAFGYVAVMVLLGLHLRHGVWSAFQSLGAMNPRLTPVVYSLGGVLAVLIALGFLVLPLYIFFST